MSQALEAANRELEALATTDALTGIANRRHFADRIELELDRCARAEEPLSLLMIDVDCFKLYNDTYGHQRGDECLHQVAQTLHRELRSGGDFVARYGGEEFVVLLSGSSLDAAKATAERLCEAIRALDLPHKTSVAASIVTVSIGVATVVPEADARWMELVEAADGALYRAKATGRNRVEV